MKDVGYLNTMPKEEFLERRKKLINLLPENSLSFIFSSKEQTRNSDCEFKFRQNSYFWYVTGFNEPDSILVIEKSNSKIETTMFLREVDPLMETWYGKRLGTKKAPESLGVDKAYNINDFMVIIKEKISKENLSIVLDESIEPWATKYKEELDLKINSTFKDILDEMRLFKSENEKKLLARAGEISASGHLRAMKNTRPGIYEYNIEHEIIYEFSRHGALYPSYNTIVAGGDNANTLHYTENDQLLQNNELVLVDAGCEFDYYAGDITRTYPVSGKFTEPQKEIYSLVLKSQKAALDFLKPGVTLQEASDLVIEILTQGLIDLGIIKESFEKAIEEKLYREFYMHGLGHWIGLDVHDVGAYRSDKSRLLELGMALTVEPGLYISKKLDVPEKYKGIGIRIEDDIIITELGNKVLTSLVPKEINDIEEIMKNSYKEI
ncbi:MAG: Xaa-Pro aminopeptidase [Psittacicella sp.]